MAGSAAKANDEQRESGDVTAGPRESNMTTNTQIEKERAQSALKKQQQNQIMPAMELIPLAWL